MTPSLALEAKRGAMRAAATRFRTANLRVFGSALHGDDRTLAVNTPRDF